LSVEGLKVRVRISGKHILLTVDLPAALRAIGTVLPLDFFDVVDVAVCNLFAGIHREFLDFLKARSLRSLTS